MAEFNYAKSRQKKNIDDTIAMLELMPAFVGYYFKANSLTLSASSQHSYMYDIYNFLKKDHSKPVILSGNTSIYGGIIGSREKLYWEHSEREPAGEGPQVLRLIKKPKELK